MSGEVERGEGMEIGLFATWITGLHYQYPFRPGPHEGEAPIVTGILTGWL
jgi:hypothetical protein